MVHNQITEKDEIEKDAIQSNSVTLSGEDCQKEVEIPIENLSKNTEEGVAKEVEIPSGTKPLVAEEDLEEEEGRNDVLEAQKEQMHQIEVNERE
jgi:hypothetical protein